MLVDMDKIKVKPPRPAKVTLWFEPGCRKCARARELLELTGSEVTLYEYLATPPTEAVLRQLLGLLGRAPSQIVRAGAAARDGLGLATASDDELLAALARQPALIECPIAVLDDGSKAVLARPPEAVLELLVPALPANTSIEEVMHLAMRGKLADRFEPEP